MIHAAKNLYDEFRGKNKPGQYVDFTCVVQGIPHVVCNIQELPGDCLMLITVIEKDANGEDATYIIYAPAEQVSFQIIQGKQENAPPPREMGFKPLMEERASEA
jgi:hypothetical protein